MIEFSFLDVHFSPANERKPAGKGAALFPCFFCRLRRFKVVGRCPTLCKPFEKGLSENFTFCAD